MEPSQGSFGALSDGDQEELLNHHEINIMEKIGDGVTSNVFRGTYQGQEVAVKEMIQSCQAMCPKARVNLERELAILRRVSHPNLVTFIGVGMHDEKVQIVSEFCEGGPAFELLHNSELELRWQQRSDMLNDITAAMHYLHRFRPPIIHRDLKSLNVLLMVEVLTERDPVVSKVMDFGLSRMLEEHGGKVVMTKDAGTCHWMAPEVFSGDQYDCKVDIYSFSILLYEIVCQDIPFADVPGNKLGLAVVKGQRPDLSALPPECPIQLCHLMMRCWAQDPTSRPDFTVIRKELLQCSLPYLDDYDQ